MDIQIRAWDEQNKEMVYPKSARGNFGIGSLSSADILKRYSTTMLCTGIKDKYKVNIYAKDIVKGLLVYPSNTDGTLPTIGVVEYCEGYAAFGLRNKAGLTLFHNHLISTFEVMGDVYENPEMTPSAT